MSELTLVSSPCPASTKCCLVLAASYSACQKDHNEFLIDLWSLSPAPGLIKKKKHVFGEMKTVANLTKKMSVFMIRHQSSCLY